LLQSKNKSSGAGSLQAYVIMFQERGIPLAVPAFCKRTAETKSCVVIMNRSPKVPDIAERFATLSNRQQQVVALLHKGLSNKEIANALGVSEGTIKCHLHSIYEKLGVQSRIELTIMFSNSTKLQSAD
jgi:DNA-binding NarL/FixJ family response regulator